MKKKKAKSKTAAKKTAKKSEPELETKELNPEQVLKNISALVEAQADKLAEAVIGEGMKGQVSPVKYLFEMAHIYPQPPAAIAPSKDEDSLAETLLDRLKIPKTPMVHDELQKEEEDEDVVVIQPKKDTGTDSESSGDEKTEAVGVE
jgi:hypothetical protein